MTVIKYCLNSIAALWLLSSCSVSFTNLEYKRGEQALSDHKYEDAIDHFKKVIRREPESKLALESAREAAHAAFYETKKFLDAVEFYGHVARFSRDERERRQAQETIAQIYFEKINNYPKAIEEYNKLLLIEADSHQIVQYRYSLARAHFYLNQFSDSQIEIESALKLAEPERKYDLKMFLGSIFFNTKHIDQAIKVYEEVEKEYPDRAKAEFLALNESVCYEEIEAYDKAIEKLESIRTTYKDPDFIELKIKRLRERKANMPGSKGLRK